MTTQHPIQKLKHELLDRGVSVEIVDGVIIYLTPVIQDNLTEYIYQVIPDNVLDEIHSEIKDDEVLWERYRQEILKINGLDINERMEGMWMEVLNQFIRASAKTQKFVERLKTMTKEEMENDEFIMMTLSEIFQINLEENP